MNDAVDRQIIGMPITVLIAGKERRLEYRFAAILAYQEKTGDSLFDQATYAKIDLVKDPRRWLACLWAGLHEQQADKSWKAPVSFEELSGLLDLSPANAAELSVKMVECMTSYFPKPKETVPNAAAPGELAPGETPAAVTSPTSPSSTPGPA